MTSRAAAAAFLVQRIGPYHHARLSAFAAARTGAVNVIEFRPADPVYAWASVDEKSGYVRHETLSRNGLLETLEVLKPEVVVCVGYADPEITQVASWALRSNVPLVTCSDSTRDDEPRSWAKERAKRWVVAAFDSALVAGGRSSDYLEALGLGVDRQFQPWDVVDNAHFAGGRDLTQGRGHPRENGLKLPSCFFLCVARFVPKKNLRRLIEAYRIYTLGAGTGSWPLVISGGGPLEGKLRARVAAAHLDSRVHFTGFLQYPDLPASYGLAGAFVLPSVSDQWGLVVNEAMAAGLPVLVSSRCGCAPDLVHEGQNGFRFDPEDTGALAALMAKVAALDEARRLDMGRRSREIIAAYSPKTFAEGLEAAIDCALARRRGRATWLTRTVLGLLARRAAPSR